MKRKGNFSRVSGIGTPKVKAISYSAKKAKRHIKYDSDGIAIKTDDNYPQLLAQISAESPTHGAAVDVKKLLTFGQGVQTDKIADEVAKSFLRSVNEKNESINDILERVSIDYWVYNGFAIRVHWGENRNIANIYHVPFKNVRLAEPNDEGEIDAYLISNCWGNKKMPRKLKKLERINAFNPDVIEKAEKEQDEAGDRTFDEESGLYWSASTLENSEQLIYYTGYSAEGDGFYPVPEYSRCMDAILLEIKCLIAMNNGLTNGINGAYLVSHSAETPINDEDEKKINDVLQDVATGEENANSTYYIPSSIRVDKLEPISGKTYDILSKIAKQHIVTGHKIPSILVEAHIGGGFNNRAEEMKAAIEQVEGTTAKAARQVITRAFNSVFSYADGDFNDFAILPFLTEEEDQDEDEAIEEAVEDDSISIQ